MEIKYKISKYTKVQKIVSIKNEHFVCVSNGRKFTAFIDETISDEKKFIYSITITSSGEFLMIKRVAGGMANNIKSLLEMDNENFLSSNEDFLYWLKKNEYKIDILKKINKK